MTRFNPGDKVWFREGHPKRVHHTVLATNGDWLWLRPSNNDSPITGFVDDYVPYVDPNVEKLEELLRNYNMTVSGYERRLANWLVARGVRVEGGDRDA